jgi:hypothetical protein
LDTDGATEAFAETEAVAFSVLGSTDSVITSMIRFAS